MHTHIVRSYEACPILSVCLAYLTLHALHLLPSFPLHGHGTPDDWQVRTCCVVAQGPCIVCRGNPGPSAFSRKAQEEVIHFFAQFSDSALTEKGVVPFVVDPPLLRKLRKHVDAVWSYVPKHFECRFGCFGLFRRRDK